MEEEQQAHYHPAKQHVRTGRGVDMDSGDGEEDEEDGDCDVESPLGDLDI